MKLKFFAWLLAFVLPLGVQAKDKIAIFPFTAHTYDSTGICKMAENAMIDLLVSQNRFDVMERAQLTQIIQEQHLQQQAQFDTEQAVAVGKIAGVRYGVLGELADASYTKVPGKDLNGKDVQIVKASLIIQLRIVDIQTGKITFSGTFKRPGGGFFDNLTSPTGTRDQVLTGWLNDIMKDDVKKKMNEIFPLSGTIVSIENHGNTVLIDIGKDGGAAKDMKFKVVQIEQKTVASTGKTLNITHKIGRIKIKEVDVDTSSCEVNEGKDALKEGMTVVTDSD